MAHTIATLRDALDHGFDTVIDVRSPAEYAEDHLPGAISLPALSDAERAEVGTIYKQESPFEARKIGAAMVARNVAAHLGGPLARMDGSWRPLVYCWRGGQRSGSVATILRAVGWRVETVEGGYRSFRRAVSSALYEDEVAHRLVLIDGNTGTAKTELLHRLAARGAQVLDLEGLARHRGSLLGSVEVPQPSQKAFETGIATALAGFSTGRPVFVEAESAKIGSLIVPPSLWKAMRASGRVEIDAPLAARARYLSRAYADLVADPGRLCDTLAQLRGLQGAERVARWQDMARAGAVVDLAAELCAEHYDPRYARSRARHGSGALATYRAGALDDAGIDALAEAVLSGPGGAAAPR